MSREEHAQAPSPEPTATEERQVFLICIVGRRFNQDMQAFDIATVTGNLWVRNEAEALGRSVTGFKAKYPGYDIMSTFVDLQPFLQPIPGSIWDGIVIP